MKNGEDKITVAVRPVFKDGGSCPMCCFGAELDYGYRCLAENLPAIRCSELSRDDRRSGHFMAE